jgi:hypothetical protein
MLRSEVRAARESEMRRRQLGLVPEAAAQPEPEPAPGKPKPFLTAKELAERWNVGITTIRRWFRNEPGVLEWGRMDSRPGRKRAYLNLRIPPEVAERVRRRMTGI